MGDSIQERHIGQGPGKAIGGGGGAGGGGGDNGAGRAFVSRDLAGEKFALLKEEGPDPVKALVARVFLLSQLLPSQPCHTHAL